jgi:acyl-coenzyme A synthetase/AMP-(fatty) acid ligase
VVRRPVESDAGGPVLDEAAVMAWVQERVAPHEKVRLVEFIDAVPKSTSGKILRKDLRARIGRHASV